jgi:hypothetical protein
MKKLIILKNREIKLLIKSLILILDIVTVFFIAAKIIGIINCSWFFVVIPYIIFNALIVTNKFKNHF